LSSLVRSSCRSAPARRVVDLIAGDKAPDPVLQGAYRLDRCPPGPSPLDWMVFTEGELARYKALIERVAAAHEAGAPPITMLVGPEGCGKSTLVWSIGQRLGLTVLRVQVSAMAREQLPPAALLWPRIVREGRLQNALVLIEGVDLLSPEDLAGLARALDRDPMLVVVLEARQSIAWQGGRATARMEMALPGNAERTTMWQREMSRRGLPVDLAESMAAKFRVTAGVVQKTLDEVANTGSLTSREKFVAAVNQRLAENREHKLGTLATRVTSRPTWSDLVLSPETVKDLERLTAQFRQRSKLMGEWGFERKMPTGQGISALFQGPPGTGKTMAASVIAGLFDLELFQIDLSRIVSKWLGETEKNLATIFDEAEKAHAIILFDEADSLFAKRTEVQSSNDRNANLEVNFLLQRMDRFQGITLLTSNFGSNVDDAFVRRLSFRIEFPAPGPVERAHLWQALTPVEMATSGHIDHESLGQRFDMSGGHIRNAIFKAAINAASEGEAVSMQHMIDAGNMEYRAIGKIVRTQQGARGEARAPGPNARFAARAASASAWTSPTGCTSRACPRCVSASSTAPSTPPPARAAARSASCTPRLCIRTSSVGTGSRWRRRGSWRTGRAGRHRGRGVPSQHARRGSADGARPRRQLRGPAGVRIRRAGREAACLGCGARRPGGRGAQVARGARPARPPRPWLPTTPGARDSRGLGAGARGDARRRAGLHELRALARRVRRHARSARLSAA